MIHWIAKNTDLPADLRIVSLVSCGMRLFAADQNNGVYVSEDKGVSWSSININLPELNITGLFVCGYGVYISTFTRGVYRSIDNGVTWTLVDNLSDFSILSSAQVNDISYLGGMDYNGNGHIYSSDDGLTWTEITDGLPDYSQAVSMVKHNDTVYVSIKSAVTPGIYKLVEDEFVFIVDYAAYNIISDGVAIVAFVGNGEQYYSLDDGDTWASFTITDNPFIVQSLFYGKFIYIGGYKRVDEVDSPIMYRSSNASTWEDISSGLEGSPVGGLTKMGNDIYCCTNGTLSGGVGLPPNCLPPAGIAFSDILSDSVTVSFSGGLGQKRFLVVSESPITCKPVNGQVYATDSVFCGGTVRYNDVGFSVVVDGLNPATLYYFALFEYNTGEIYYPFPAIGQQDTSSFVPPLDAPVFNFTYPAYSKDSLAWDAVPGALAYDVEIAHENDPLFENPIVSVSNTTDLFYALLDFYRNNTILGTGYVGSADARIRNSFIMYFNGLNEGDPFDMGMGAQIILSEWGGSTASIIVNLTNEIFPIRVRAKNGERVSDWTTDAIQLFFDENQISILTMLNSAGNSVNFNTDYGQAMSIHCEKPTTFLEWYFACATNPAHAEAAFKTLPIVIPVI